ncbi:MAG TPA: hypothetical protein VKD90_00835, partial [Gemmataceae bacterium]|nr:hypothetical protein [Gemmataceae bacterium]
AETMARTGLLDFPQNPVGGQTPPPVQLRVFVDEWGKHIAFRRQADDYDTAILDELNQAPFVDASKIPTGNLDPQDPDGRLKKPTTAWGNVVNQNGQQENGKVVATRFLAYTNQGSRPYILDPFDGRNRGPFAFSAGKDDTFYTDNDLYSFRLAQQGRGN